MAEGKTNASIMRTVLICSALFRLAASQSVDGGRSELPGMKRDMFDQVQGQKGRPPPRGKGPPPCPKSDGWSPFTAIAFTSSQAFVKLSPTEERCKQLISIGGVNLTQLINASRTCGPAGEFKRRIAENMSSMFFQGGFEWVRSENETIEVITEDGTFEAHVNEDNYAVMMECWRYGCGCEQVNNPLMRGILIALLVIAVGGLGYDSFKALWEYFRPPKKVEKSEKPEKSEKKEKKDKKEKKAEKSEKAEASETEKSEKSETEKSEKSEKSEKKEKKDKKEKKAEKSEKAEASETEKSEKSETEKSEKSGTEADIPKTDTDASGPATSDDVLDSASIGPPSSISGKELVSGPPPSWATQLCNDEGKRTTNDTNEVKEKEEAAAEVPP